MKRKFIDLQAEEIGSVSFITVLIAGQVELSPPVLTSFATAEIRTFNYWHHDGYSIEVNAYWYVLDDLIRRNYWKNCRMCCKLVISFISALLFRFQVFIFIAKLLFALSIYSKMKAHNLLGVFGENYFFSTNDILIIMILPAWLLIWCCKYNF